MLSCLVLLLIMQCLSLPAYQHLGGDCVVQGQGDRGLQGQAATGDAAGQAGRQAGSACVLFGGGARKGVRTCVHVRGQIRGHVAGSTT